MQFFVIVALVLLCSASPGRCEVVKVSANEVHESANNNIVKSFIEDVISLLPREFTKNLDAEVIQASVKFNGNRNKWLNYSTMSEKDLGNIYARLLNRYAKYGIGKIELSDELGNTVATIIEATMAHGGNDPLGDKFKSNLENFFKEEYKMTHVIKYEGYKECTVKTCISRIYDLARYNKSSVYPLMVTRTADLWTAIYKARAGEMVSDAKTIVRRPMNVAYTGKSSEVPAGTKSGSGDSETASARNSDSSKSNGNNAADNSREPDTAIIILVPVR